MPTNAGSASSTLHDFVESMPDGIVIVDAGGHIVLANRRAHEMFGYDAGELTGKVVDQLMPERFRQPHGHHERRYF